MRFVPVIFAFVIGFNLSASGQSAAQIPDGFFDVLQYRHVGPVGNRVTAVVGVPGDPNVYYFGAAAGGVFKSVDGGVHWTPVFDREPVQSIGALAIDPTNPNVVWAGTGETFIRSNVSVGNGIYQSVDGGKTWTHRGLDATGRIGRIVIHPRNPHVVFAAALGHLYGPQPERGVFRTTDGGATWERVLFVDEQTGAADIVMDPNNPEILFAAMWQMIIRTWGRESGGPGSGLYRSKDGGTTWEKLQGNGLPTPPLGKIGLAMSPDNSNRVYALIETNSNRDYAPLTDHQGVLWRSDDGGDHWQMVNADHALDQRPLYYSRLAVAPDDQDEVHFMSTVHTRSLDGGRTVERVAGGDNHDIWIDPLIPDRMIVGNDQGVSISTTRGRQWMRPQLPTAQMYHVRTDHQVPYHVFGNRQDGPSARGPSNTLTGGDIPIGAWHWVGGCESGYSVPDPVDDNIVWSGCYEGILDRYDVRTGHARNVSVWPDNPEGWAAADLRYRFQWTFPIATSPHEQGKVYVGSQYVHQTTNGGQSWTVISPDLTTNDKSRQQKTGGLTTEDVSPTYASVLFAIAESPVEPGVIWAGSNDGLVHVTRDGGGTWTNVTGTIPDLPPWGTVSNIEPSQHAGGTAYLSVDFHQTGDFEPYIFKTSDYGQHWRPLAAGIPHSVFSYVHVIREDPVRPGLLYAGTENTVYASLDDGQSWFPIQSNLPHVPTYDLVIQNDFNDLVLATYGRGFWIADDITPLQQTTDAVLAAPVHLFPPRDTYRFLWRQSANSQPGDPGAGENPEYGVSIHYYLREAVDGHATLRILDPRGVEVRTLEGPGGAGLHRVQWDLRWTASTQPRLRTPALEHSHVTVGDRGWRPAGDGGRVSPLAAPGVYTVVLEVDDTSLTRELTVLKDPNSAGSTAEIREQVARLLQLRDDADSTAAMIDEIEWIRRQLLDISQRLGDEADVVASSRNLDKQFIELEMRLTDLRLSGGLARQDAIRWPRQLFAKITSLAGYIGGSDYRPTDQQVEVHEMYRQMLADYQTQLRQLIDGQVTAFNRLLTGKGYSVVITRGPGVSE